MMNIFKKVEGNVHKIRKLKSKVNTLLVDLTILNILRAFALSTYVCVNILICLNILNLDIFFIYLWLNHFKLRYKHHNTSSLNIGA